MAGWAPTHPRGSKHPPLTPGGGASRGDAATSRDERGRPPARRGRAGGFHWCPGHRGCRVTALVTALRRNSCLNHPCPSTAGVKWGNNHCQLRASRRLCPGPSKGVAKPPPRISLPRCSVRCRSWPSPFPPVRVKPSKRCANKPGWLNDAVTARFAGIRGRAAACCHRYTGAAPGAGKWPARRTAVRFQRSCNVDDTAHSLG